MYGRSGWIIRGNNYFCNKGVTMRLFAPKRCTESSEKPVPLNKRDFYHQEVDRCTLKRDAQIEALNNVFEAMREDGIISQADLVWMQRTIINNTTRWYEIHLQNCRKKLLSVVRGGDASA